MKIFLLMFLCSVSALAAEITGDWALKSSTLIYTVDHPLKTAHGKSTAAKGKGHCGPAKCDFLLAVPVKSFDSGDSNRDLHMLETVRGASNPLTSVRISGPIRFEGRQASMDATVDFAGRQHRYEGVRFEIVEATATALQVKGTLKLSLKDFEITPPSLLMREVKDEVPIAVDLAFIRP
jgi:hypothetical protein